MILQEDAENEFGLVELNLCYLSELLCKCLGLIGTFLQEDAEIAEGKPICANQTSVSPFSPVPMYWF